MKPVFIMMKTIDENGDTRVVPINPNLVCMVVPAVVAGVIDGPGGQKIGRHVAALDFGLKVIPVDYNVKGAVAVLEGKKSDG